MHEKSLKILILLYSFLFLSIQASASEDMPSLLLPQNALSTQDYLLVLDNIPENTSFDSIKGISLDSYKHFSAIVKNLKRNKSYWIRLRITNNAPDTHVYYFETGITQEIDLYEPDASGRYIKKPYGYSVPDGQKEYSELVAEVVGLKLLPHQEKTIFFRVKSELNLKPSPLFKVKEERKFIHHQQIFNFLQGLFHGLVWMMVAYISFMYFNVRDRAYLYYILYAATFSIAIATLIGYPRFYLFRDHIFHVLYSEIILQISSFFLILLFRKVLNIKDISPKCSLFYKIALWVTGIGIAITGAFLFIDFYLYNLISQISVFCSLIFYFIILVGLFKFKTSLTIYYFIGNLSLTIGSFIITIALLFFRKPFLDFFPLFQFTAVVEAIFFAIGLSKRFQDIERQKRRAQSEYIHELKEKEALQLKINEDLEELVHERTLEILRSKEQLEIQRSNLAMKHILLEDSNRTLTENLEYAGFMQKALLDDFDTVRNVFEDAFLLYKPYSFVSGDFYMFFELQDGKNIIIVADCTGHGVPGAILTFIAQGFIQDLVRRKKVFCPSELLHHLEERICTRLLSASSGKSLREGLDASVVYVDTFLRQIQFSGARMPMFFCADGQIQRVKGSLHGIGGGASATLRERSFTKHTLNYSSGDSFFLTTDGYTDQLNADKKKFLVSRFLQLLDFVSSETCDSQKQSLDDQHKTWKADQGQTDDILIVGVKLK